MDIDGIGEHRQSAWATQLKLAASVQRGMIVNVDASDISNLLQVLGTLIAFVGSVVTGVGLWLGWRRLLERRTEEMRASVQGSTGGLSAAASATATAGVMVTPMPGQGPEDAPVTRGQLTTVVSSLHQEIQRLRGELHTVRTDVAGLPIVRSSEVEARARQVLAEHEHQEGATAFADLSWALIGVGISALGSVIGLFGLFVGWY